MPPPQKHADRDSNKCYRTHSCSADDSYRMTSWYALLWLSWGKGNEYEQCTQDKEETISLCHGYIFLRRSKWSTISLLRSSGGYERGSSDTDEQLSPDLTPQINEFPAMLSSQATVKKVETKEQVIVYSMHTPWGNWISQVARNKPNELPESSWRNLWQRTAQIVKWKIPVKQVNCNCLLRYTDERGKQ